MAKKKETGAPLGYEAELWQMADALRGSMDAAEYKHVVLGLIFLKYISDAFEEQHLKLLKEKAQGADAEDPDEYRAVGVFWVPPEARWSHLMPKDYARPNLDKQRLGQLIDLMSNIKVGDRESRSKDVLGRVYEYFLSQFASAEGKKGGEFYTPRCVVKLLVEMLEPYKGRVYDPCCGSSGMFVQSEEFIAAHGGKLGDISIYGQESNYTTWRLAKMNLAIRGIDGQIAHGDSFHNDCHADLKADFILANPPFNVSDWGGERLREDKRWKYGVPPAGNANFAWVEHIVHHLAPSGIAGFVLANGSMSSNQSGEGEIRKNLIEADLVDCMVALPGQLFYSTQIPACLWFLARDRKDGKFRDRRGHLLFIDARKLGRMVDRTHRELTDEDIDRIADTYHAWRGEKDAGVYADVPGFCKSAPLDEIRKHGFVLTPGRYVGSEAQEDDGESFEKKMKRLTATLREQQGEAAKLDAAIAANLRELGMAGESWLPSQADVCRRVVAAICRLDQHDRGLLARDANERSITHKLAEHLQREFPDWHVDCEYNRRGESPKRLNLPLEGLKVDAGATEARTVFPDVIIHRRGTDRNLVVIEVKKRSGIEDTKDREKIEAFSRSPEYHYEYGLVLKLGVDGAADLKRYCAESNSWEDWSDELQCALRELGHEG